MEAHPEFFRLMDDAHRATLALDNFLAGDRSGAKSAAVTEGLRVYSQLLDYRSTEGVTLAQACMLETALEALRVRLRNLGETVRISDAQTENPPSSPLTGSKAD
jgi:hypothetical protein